MVGTPAFSQSEIAEIIGARLGKQVRVEAQSREIWEANARRNRLKLMVFDGTGLWVCAKRLEKGCFRWPESGEGEARIVLTHEELAMLLGGIDLTQTRRRAWYRRASGEESEHSRITA